MKALLIVLALAIVIVHVWLSHGLYHGPNKALLESGPVELEDGVSIRYEYLDRILEGEISDPSKLAAAEQAVGQLRPPGRIDNRIKIGTSFFAGWADGQLNLRGLVPNTAIKQSVLVASSKLDPSESGEQLLVGQQAESPAWAEAVAGFMSDFFSKTNAGEISIKSGAVSLTGKVGDQMQKQDLIAAANDWGLAVNDQITFPTKPSTLLASLRNGVVTVSGDVPTAAMKTQLGNQFSKTGFKVKNQLKVDGNTAKPKWLDSLAGYLPKYFKGIKSGELEITADKLRIKRPVQNERSQTELLNEAKSIHANVVNQLQLAKRPAPTLPKQPAKILAIVSNGVLKLTGQLPSESLKRSVASTAGKSLPGVRIVNQLGVDKGKVKEPSWKDQVSPLLADFLAGQPKSAEFEITPNSLRLKREVADRATQEKMIAMARGILPSDGSFKNQITIARKEVIPEPVIVTKPTPVPKSPPTESARILAVLNYNGLQITGQVADQKSKNALTQVAIKTLPGVNVRNELVVDKDKVKSPPWQNSIDDMFGTFFAPKPAVAEFEITPEKLRLKQQLADEGTRDLMLVKAKRLTSGKTQFIDQLSIRRRPARAVPQTLSPTTVMARIPPGVPTEPARVLVVLKNREMSLTGQVPSNEMKISVAEAARKQLAGVRIANDLTVDKNVRTPAWDLRVLSLLSDFFYSSNDSEFEIDPFKIRLKRDLPDYETKDLWQHRIERFMPGHNRFNDQLSISTSAPRPRPMTVDVVDRPSLPEPKVASFEIYYATNSTWINFKHQAQIEQAVKTFGRRGEKLRFKVKGYADNRGSFSFNKRLSEGRANEVVKSLVSHGIRRSDIEVLAVGEAEVRKSGDNKADRRVEVTIIHQ